MAVLNSSLILQLIDEVTAPARAVDASIKRLRAQSEANSRAMDQMQGQMLRAAAAGYALYRGLAAPVQAAIEFESAMADVAKVSGFDEAGLTDFGKDLRQLATGEIPMAVTELAALAEAAAQSGVADGDLLEFTRMTAKAALAWGVSGAQAGEDLAKIQSALNLTIEQTMLYADAINHLSDNTASSASDLTDYSRRVAAQGEFFGYTKEETLAFGAAMVGTGAEAEVAATSFRNMGRALTKGTAHTPKTIKAFRSLGLDAAKVAKAMQEDAVGTTLEVIKRIGQVPEHLRPAIMQQIFGDEARALAPLLGNVEILERALGYVADETVYAGSVATEFGRRAETTQFAVQKFKNQIHELAMAVGNALMPPLNQFLATIGPIIGALAEFASQHPGIVQGVVAIAGALVGLTVASTAARFAFLFLKGGLLDIGVATLSAVSGLMTLLNPMNIVKNAAYALRTALLLSGVGIAIAGIALAGTWVYNNWSQVSAFFQGFGQGIMAAMAPVMPALQPVLDWISGLVGWFTQLVGPMDATSTEAYNLGTALGTITGQAIVDLLTWLRELPGAAWAAATSMAAAGAAMGMALWTGIVTKVTELINSAVQWGSEIAQSIVTAFVGIGQELANAFMSTDWVAVGLSIANAIWQGIQQIIPTMVAGLGSALASINPFGGGGEAAGPRVVQPGDVTPGGQTIGGAFASGGHVTRGMTALVGELGPEIVTFGANGFVHPNGSLPSAPGLPSFGGGGGGSSASMSIGDIHVHVQTPTNADPNAIARSVGDVVSARARAMLSDGAF